jgi:hypothetical protein
MTTRTGARLLAGLSCLGFVVGLYFPLMVLMDPGPSARAYGILLVSFPAWSVGALSGGVAGYLAGRGEGRAAGRAPRLARLSWWIGGLNLAAIVLCLIWQPAGVS